LAELSAAAVSLLSDAARAMRVINYLQLTIYIQSSGMVENRAFGTVIVISRARP
jgi:hypothetical protein